MRWLRITACILALWAFSALLFRDLGVRAWFRTPSAAALQWRAKERTTEKLIACAGAGALVCLALSSLIDFGKRPRRITPDTPIAAPPTDGPISRDPTRS